MRKATARKLQWGAFAAIPVYAAAVFLIISQQPDRPGWQNCLLITLGLEILALLYYSACAISCGNADEPLDPACVRRCFRMFLIIQAVLIAFFLSCVIGSQWL